MTTARKPRPALPGTAGPDIDAMIRVDHAGEYGAMRIYQGQLAVLAKDRTARESVGAIKHMAEQERGHFDIFDRLVRERRVRPTLLQPFWHVAGYALGASTALLGEKAAMACTVAVEEAIDAHYARQSEELAGADEPLKETIDRCRAEEAEHRDEAIRRGAEQAPAYPLLSAAIKWGCRVAITLSEKL